MLQRHMPSCRRLILVLLVFLGLLAAGVAFAQAPDADGDGVADARDACPDTPSFDVVGADGCSLCTCDDAWSSHLDYLHCVINAVHVRRMAHAITRARARLVLRAARDATCGDDNLVRCCIMFSGKPTGLCRVMDEMRCDPDLIPADDVVDMDTGSCLPNPCQ